MKVIFDKSSIISAVAPLMCAVSGKSVLSTIEGILIEAKMPDTVTLTTYDLEKGVRVTVEAKVIEEGSFIINAQKFNQTIKVMGEDEITLTVDNKMIACITSGRSSHRMSALAGADFPAIPDLASDRSFIVGQAVLKKMIGQISFAMAVNDQRAVLNGAFFKIDDESIMTVACDGFKSAKCKSTVELENKNTNGNAHLDYSFIVPVKTVNELSRLLSDDEEALTQIYVTRKHIVCLIGELTFFSRLIDGNYIDFERIVIRNHKITVSAPKAELVSALEKAALVTEERIAGSVRSHVRLEITGGLLKVSATSASGAIYDEVAVEQEGPDIVIAFNNRFLIDSVRACDTDKIKISLSTALTSINIEPGEELEGKEEIFMILPVRMKE